MSYVQTEISDGVATVSLDDPDRRNALNAEMVDEIVAAFDAIEADDAVGAVVVTGNGKGFCAGADLSHLGSSRREGLLHIYEGFLRVGRSPLPTIAAVNGAAVGAGMNLALVCDVRLASYSARFDTRFLRIGLHPGGGHTWMLERAVGPQAAAAMVVFGERVDGPRAAEIGLAWACHPDDELIERAVELAARAAAVPKELAGATLDTLREAPWQPDFAAAVTTEIGRQTWSMGQGWFRP